MMCGASSAFPQTATVTKPAPIAATAPTAVPALVPYSAIAEGADGKPLAGEVSMTFLLFKDESGGEPLWTETQIIPIDATGRYNAQLGASSPSGLPLEIFSTGTARWLEVQIAGQRPQPRTLLIHRSLRRESSRRRHPRWPARFRVRARRNSIQHHGHECRRSLAGRRIDRDHHRRHQRLPAEVHRV